MATDTPQISLAQIAQHVGNRVIVIGRVESRRTAGGLVFLEIRGDGGETVQSVFAKNEVSEETFATARSAAREYAVRILADVREDQRAPSGYELQAHSVEILSDAPEWPFAGIELTKERRIDERHLYLRTLRMRSLLKVRAIFSREARRWLDDQGFYAVDAPIFTPNAVEERATLFETARFQSMAFLTQSGQLYNEAAAAALGKIYSFGPTFRSEPTPTRRHLAEFWMIEPEMSGADLDEMMNVAEGFVRDVVLRTAQLCAKELELLGRDSSVLDELKEPFERIRYVDAVREAQELGVDIREGEDLSIDAESAITRDRRRPVFVTHYPREVKPFYMHTDPDDPNYVMCADLLAPEGYGEILGGGERESDYETLVRNLKQAGISPDGYHWYLDLRKYGAMMQSGFGMGLERALAWVCGLDNMDETIPFPRTPHRSSP